MFDIELPGPDDLSGADDHALVAAVAGWGRVEAAAAARRLAVIAELVERTTSGHGARSRWACDGWDATAAEVAAAAGSTRGRASNQMYVATALRHRLPQVAGLFAEGTLSAAVVGTIVWHTTLVEDLATLAVIDAALAGEAHYYGQLSATKTVAAIHAVIEAHDPAAVRRSREAARSRDLVVDTGNSESGTTALWGRLYAHDATVLDRRLAAMAHGVCDDDPRTLGQRRADALAALAAGSGHLACACDNPHCPTGIGPQDGAAGAAVVYVVADADSIDTPADSQHHGDLPRSRRGDPDAASDPEPVVRAKPAQIVGGPIIPAPVLADLIRSGATVRPLQVPGPDSQPESHYRPSAKLADFIRCRDLTCRFPGCDQPAPGCDIDHAIAWADGGATHPGNLRLLCRKHHLLKTFWEWHDRQFPNGTVVWTSPSGHAYTTHPGSRVLFPALCQPTGQPPPVTAPAQAATACRTLMMPTRRRTRAEDRRAGIKAERALNGARANETLAERDRPPPS